MTRKNSLRNAFKTSPKAEKEGIELELANARLRLARAGGQNTKFNAAMSEAFSKHKRAIDLNIMQDEAAKKILYDIFAVHIVLGWETNVAEDGQPEDWREGIEGENDELLPVTAENIVAFFTELPDFFIEVKNTAENVQFYRQSLVAEIAGN